MKPFSLKILYLYQISENYYFELIANKAVPKEVVLLHETIGGGSKNPQWRKIREKIINIPIVSCNKTTSFGTALLAINSK